MLWLNDKRLNNLPSTAEKGYVSRDHGYVMHIYHKGSETWKIGRKKSYLNHYDYGKGMSVIGHQVC